MAADRQRLAAALAYEEERRRRMMESVPTTDNLPPVQPSRRNLRTDLENLSSGIGQGVVNQLEGVKALVTDPVGTARAAYEGVKGIVRDPTVLADALRYTAQKATSGPLGAGEVIGEMVSPMRGKGPMAEIENAGRAKAGGEVAASNGYFYKGGQFLPTTEAEPGKWKIGKKTVTTGKELIAPGELAVQPTPFSRSIYQAALRDVTEPTPQGLVFRPGIKDYRGNEITPETGIRIGVKGVLGKEELSIKELIDAYNSGQRWYDVDPDAPVKRSK